MALNHWFWRRVFQEKFSKQLRAVEEALERRVLPGFDNIEAEARAITDEAWEAIMSSPSTGDEDHSQLAEAAQELGIDHYFLMFGMRQGMVNLFAAALYHLFEQQMMYFHRRELLDIRETHDAALYSQKEMRARLESYSIDISKFPSWSTIDELRLLANTIKHAEGKSAAELEERRPDLFKEPGLPVLGEWEPKVPRRVFQPIAGEGIYLSLAQVKEYNEVLLQYWEELFEAMKGCARS